MTGKVTAMEMHKKALRIKVKALGTEEHASVGNTKYNMALSTTTKRWTLVRASPVPPQERQTMRSFLLRGVQQSTRLARSRPRNVASLTWCLVPRPRTGA